MLIKTQEIEIANSNRQAHPLASGKLDSNPNRTTRTIRYRVLMQQPRYTRYRYALGGENTDDMVSHETRASHADPKRWRSALANGIPLSLLKQRDRST
jgi:hypothetical protein